MSVVTSSNLHHCFITVSLCRNRWIAIDLSLSFEALLPAKRTATVSNNGKQPKKTTVT
jgi:hypothetical protein